MRPLVLPPGDDPQARSFAAAIGAILELDAEHVPAFEQLGDWSAWLAERGLGLVPVADPQTFMWPGPWIGLLDDGTAVVAFGSPPGIAWHPLGGDKPFAEVRSGFAIAPHDVALWAQAPTETDRTDGLVELIAIAPAATVPMETVEHVEAVPGRGLRGDRYFDGAGTFSGNAGNGREVTLVEAEHLDALGLIGYPEARRNVVTRGIDLNALVGRRFAVGAVELVGRRLCEPCAHLARLTEPGTLPGLVHNGGLRADLVTGGELRVGDRVRTL